MSSEMPKITIDELAALFPKGVPDVAMKITFPEQFRPLTTEEVRQVVTALSRPEAIGEGAGPVGWETEAEWALEQRAFHWNERWTTEETRALINDLWRQYCLAAEPAVSR